jgi:ribosomal protein S18 acetylase RimI-like enzyme
MDDATVPTQRPPVAVDVRSPYAVRALELHEARGHATGHRSVTDLGDAILLHDPAERGPFLNRLSAMRLPTDRGACDHRLAELYALFASLDRQPHVWLSPTIDWPPDLAERLQADGFIDVGGTYTMVLRRNANGVEAPLPAGARLDRLSTAGRHRSLVLEGAAQVLVEAFGGDEAGRAQVAEDLAGTGLGDRDVCLISVDGAPVAAGRRYTADGMTYLSSIGTRPVWWGRGFGAAVTATLAADGFSAGGTLVHLGVECTNERALGLYARLGFEILGDRIADLLLG